MHGSISKAQGVIDDNPILKVPDMDKEFLVCTTCIQGRFRWSFDARWSSDRLHFKEIEKA
jgi:hypothetical protein